MWGPGLVFLQHLCCNCELRFDLHPQRVLLSCVFLLVATYPGGMEVGESFHITGHC